MKRINVFCIALLITITAGCGGGSDDGGGSSGGSGDVTCSNATGVYNGSDGSRLELEADCEFIITLADGNYGHGVYTDFGENYFTADFVVDTGASKGQCGTITYNNGTVTVSVTNQCS